MKVACVLITHLRAKCELRRQPALAAAPAVIVDRSAGSPQVSDVFPAVTGVAVGMSLEEALSHNADTVVIGSQRTGIPADIPAGAYLLAGD